MFDLWRTVHNEIENSVDKSTFNTFFKNLELISYIDDIATINSLNIFIQKNCQTKYDDLIHAAFIKSGTTPKSINYIISSTDTKKSPTSRHEANNDLISSLEKRKFQPNISPKKSDHSSGLNPRYTFDTFITGSNNDLAVAACQSVVKFYPKPKYNPIFLYGSVGIGKTHLMQAVGNEIQKTHPEAKVLYTPIADFYRDFIESVKNHKGDYANKYRKVDILIIDDIQFITGKEKSQEEFFHIFNTLHQKEKQIIISSDRHPSEIATLEDRLRTRFEMGMIIDIGMPDFETRCAIIKAKSELSGIDLDEKVIEFIANTNKTNIRELEGDLNKLLATAEVKNIEPDLELAEGLLSSVKQFRTYHVTTKQIIEKTARYFQINPKDIISPSRTKNINEARQISMFLIRQELKMSYPAIAKEVGRKDHTTIMHGVQKMEKLFQEDLVFRSYISEVRENLYV